MLAVHSRSHYEIRSMINTFQKKEKRKLLYTLKNEYVDETIEFHIGWC